MRKKITIFILSVLMIAESILPVYASSANSGEETVQLETFEDAENNEEFMESAGNPYPQTYTDSSGVYHPGNCTWQVWEEAYNRLGIRLPGWGNAGTWCSKATGAGYTVIPYTSGAIPPSNSIIEWSGHVAWVLSADSKGVNLREGNILLNGSYKAVHEQWWSWATLKKYRGNPKGFICLTKSGTSGAVSYKNLKTESVDSRNACLYGEIHNPNRLTVSKVGAYVWDAAGNAIVSHSEACGRNNSVIYQRLNIVSEARPQGLKSGAKYTYQFYAVVNGKTFYSGKSSFTTVDNEPPKITNVRITNITSDGYTVSCTATDNAGVNRVQFPTWTMANGQDDIVPDWGRDTRVRGIKNGNTYTFHVKRSDHNYEYGRYRTDIYAYDNSGNEICVQGDEVILQAKESVSLNRTSLIINMPGQKATLTATVTPSSVKDKSVSWSSNNTVVATVNAHGVVTAVSKGTAVITVTTKANGAKAKCTVTVLNEIPKPGSTKISITGKTESSVTLKWNKVREATGYNIYYYSEYDKTVQAVDVYGGETNTRKITGLQPGTKYYFAIQAKRWSAGEYAYGDRSSYVRGTTMPRKAMLRKVSAVNGKIKVTLAGHAAGADKYAMCYSTRPDFRDYKVGIRTAYTSRTMTPKFRKGTYYVKVRAYKELGNGQRVYGKWSNRMQVTVK